MSEVTPQIPQTKRRLRVLHFVSGGFSGATQVAIDLCGEQTDQETLLVLRRRVSINPMPRVRELRESGLNVKVVTRWPRIATILILRYMCKKWKPDVLVAHGFSEHLWGRYAGLLAGVPRLIHVEHNVRERYGFWRLRQSLWLAQRTEKIIAVSEAVRNALIAIGHPADRCAVVLNGIDMDRWVHGIPWDERETAIVMPARFGAQKDQFTLIRAVAIMAQQGITLPLYLAGEGKALWQNRARKLAQELQVDSQVHFLGHVKELPKLMGRVKFCVLSTHYEGLGLGLIEGMASGCCSIGTDVEGMQEALTDGETGFLVPHEDAQALANTLIRLVRDDTLAARMAQQGQIHARQNFNRHRMREEYLELFKEPTTKLRRRATDRAPKP